MLDELMPKGLHAAAEELGLDPFGLIALAVGADELPAGQLKFDPELVDRLRDVGGIEPSWWDGVDLPKDADPRRARVRAALQLLLDKGAVGDKTTRADNVWRGLSSEDQYLLENALNVLEEEGLLAMTPSRLGRMVSVVPVHKPALETIAAGKGSSTAFDAVFQD